MSSGANRKYRTITRSVRVRPEQFDFEGPTEVVLPRGRSEVTETVRDPALAAIESLMERTVTSSTSRRRSPLYLGPSPWDFQSFHTAIRPAISDPVEAAPTRVVSISPPPKRNHTFRDAAREFERVLSTSRWVMPLMAFSAALMTFAVLV